jgi:hypothetical protein
VNLLTVIRAGVRLLLAQAWGDLRSRRAARRNTAAEEVRAENERLGMERDWYRDAHEKGKEILDDLRIPSKDIVLPAETREWIEDWHNETFFPPGTHPSAAVERTVAGSLAGSGQEHPDTALSTGTEGKLNA